MSIQFNAERKLIEMPSRLTAQPRWVLENQLYSKRRNIELRPPAKKLPMSAWDIGCLIFLGAASIISAGFIAYLAFDFVTDQLAKI